MTWHKAKPISTGENSCPESNARRDYVPNCIADSIVRGSVQAGDSKSAEVLANAY
jgi:hypothetical protein